MDNVASNTIDVLKNLKHNFDNFLTGGGAKKKAPKKVVKKVKKVKIVKKVKKDKKRGGYIDENPNINPPVNAPNSFPPPKNIPVSPPAPPPKTISPVFNDSHKNTPIGQTADNMMSGIKYLTNQITGGTPSKSSNKSSNKDKIVSSLLHLSKSSNYDGISSTKPKLSKISEEKMEVDDISELVSELKKHSLSDRPVTITTSKVSISVAEPTTVKSKSTTNTVSQSALKLKKTSRKSKIDSDDLSKAFSSLAVSRRTSNRKSVPPERFTPSFYRSTPKNSKKTN